MKDQTDPDRSQAPAHEPAQRVSWHCTEQYAALESRTAVKSSLHSGVVHGSRELCSSSRVCTAAVHSCEQHESREAAGQNI